MQAAKVLGLTLAMMGMTGGVAWSCEPPPPNVVRLNPFVTQGAATLQIKDRPLLPPNVDFAITVMHVDRVEAGSFKLLREPAERGQPELALTAEARANEVTVRVQSAKPLAAGANYAVYGVLAGKRQRVFQFHTDAVEDRVAPTSPQIARSVHIAAFKAGGGLCDDGHARLILTLAARAGETGDDTQRYLVEGAGEPQLLSAWCRLVDIRLPPGTTGPLRLTAIDLAGNRSPTQNVTIPSPQSGSWDAVRAARECSPSR